MNDSCKISTQIGGKFCKEEKGLFMLKKTLKECDVIVNYPESDEIIGEYNGVAVTFIPTKDKSFYKVEKLFFQSIKESSIHIVHNKFLEKIGYIGESAAIEIAYAMLHNKPIIFLNDPIFSEKVSLIIRDIILQNTNIVFKKDLMLYSKEYITKYLNEIPNKVYYDLDIEDEIVIMKEVSQMLAIYRKIV